MKRSLAGLTAVLAVVSWPLAVARAQEPGARGQESGIRSQESGARAPSLLAEAARRVDAETSIAAELRYRVDAFGHQLLGTGSYLQSGTGLARQLRLDLRMQVGEQPATLQEIRGREYFWIRRDVPPAEPTLRRVDLIQLRRALRGDPAGGEEVLPRGAWIMLGGLPRLLAALDQAFEFSPPRAEQVQLGGSGGEPSQLPIWVLEGRWKPSRLNALSGGADARNLPEHLPDRVEVVLDRSDKILPLFPYRISYFRTPEAKQSGSPSVPRELLTLELFNVRRVGPIDPRQFEYNAGEQEVLDLTTAYIQHLGGERKAR